MTLLSSRRRSEGESGVRVMGMPLLRDSPRVPAIAESNHSLSQIFQVGRLVGERGERLVDVQKELTTEGLRFGFEDFECSNMMKDSGGRVVCIGFKKLSIEC